MPQMRNRFRLSWVVTCTIVLALIPASAARAAVATSCSFDAPTATVTGIVGTDVTTTLGRSGTAITFDGVPCGTADVTNTDQINISAPDTTSSETITISEAGGTFAPGKTAEADGSNEIEFAVTRSAEDTVGFVGTGDADTIDVDHDGADLLPGSPNEDEVQFTSFVAGPVAIDGGAGDDALSARVYQASIDGGPGDDSITAGGSQASSYAGGTGMDTITFPYGVVKATDTSNDYDLDRGGTTDAITSMETLVGGDGNDGFVGSAGNDHFIGGGGDDLFIPLGGDDIVEGDAGFDQDSLGAGGVSLHVDLTSGTSTGDGSDTFTGIEALVGSVLTDRFTGDPRTSGVVGVAGYGGHDVLDMRTATHRQFVWTTPDSIAGAPSWVRLAAQDIRRIQGSDRSDRIEVGDVNGNELRARFNGNGGDDLLVGGIHHDVLRGGPGDDTLDGKARLDVCYGGAGVNTYINC